MCIRDRINQELRAPKIYLNNLTTGRLEKKSELKILRIEYKNKLNNLYWEIEIIEKQIRCQRAYTLWEEKKECSTPDTYNKYSLK